MFYIIVLQQVLVEVRQPFIDSKVFAIDGEFVRNSFARRGAVLWARFAAVGLCFQIVPACFLLDRVDVQFN